MVGMLGCGCCESGCCPEGNEWSYTYNLSNPFYPWPFTSQAGGVFGGNLTDSGLEFRSPAPYTNPQPFVQGTRKFDQLQSVSLPVNNQDPPIKHGFGKLDLRNLRHTIIAPTREQFESWRPYDSIPVGYVQGLEMTLRIGLAVTTSGAPLFEGWSIGLDYVWTKTITKAAGNINVPSYKLEVKGWFGDRAFNPLEYQTIRTYGPHSYASVIYFAGEFVSHQLDLISKINLNNFPGMPPTTYDCTAFSFGAATQQPSDNLLIDPWLYYSQKLVEHNKGTTNNILSCFPYFYVLVLWKPTFGSLGLASHSFANTKVVLRNTNWTYGNRLSL